MSGQMDKTERVDARVGRQSALGHLSIPWKFALTVVPLAVIALLAALFGMWSAEGGTTAVVIAAVVLVAAAGTVLTAFLVGRLIAESIGEVRAATDKIARKDLIDLLNALRSPEADVSRIAPPQVDTGRQDEVGELARSVHRLHAVLVEVGSRQLETLRGGISNIFVTLARRNSSLVDRQLAVLDELEEREEDPKTLRGFYRVDHLATRMRRNAESLLVLAGSEAPRIWAKPTDVSDVVRAAVGEVDEFHRVEVPALEPARLSGGAVSDISHLLAELLENAIQFSPPSEPVRVTGLFDDGGYQLSVSDRGVGMTESRAEELNRILQRPPTLGLSVEPTLGIYVVSKLAHRHGVSVQLVRGVPGITARVTIPRDHLETIDRSQPHHLETAEKEAAEPDLSEYPDAATREYILKRTRRPVDMPAASEESDHVIDLTDADPAEAESSSDHLSTESPSDTLPMRKPGQTLGDDDSSAPTIGTGEGAIGIKSALSAYDRGRRAAEEASAERRDET